eukprot:scaffold2059_cov106-Isochrysis_galbana.AAC.4
MGDPLRYPEIRSQRFLYAHKHLYRRAFLTMTMMSFLWCMGSQQHDLSRRALTLLLKLYHDNDYNYMRFIWHDHIKHSCRLGVCPNYFFEQDAFRTFATGGPNLPGPGRSRTIHSFLPHGLTVLVDGRVIMRLGGCGCGRPGRGDEGSSRRLQPTVVNSSCSAVKHTLLPKLGITSNWVAVRMAGSSAVRKGARGGRGGSRAAPWKGKRAVSSEG